MKFHVYICCERKFSSREMHNLHNMSEENCNKCRWFIWIYDLWNVSSAVSIQEWTNMQWCKWSTKTHFPQHSIQFFVVVVFMSLVVHPANTSLSFIPSMVTHCACSPHDGKCNICNWKWEITLNVMQVRSSSAAMIWKREQKTSTISVPC